MLLGPRVVYRLNFALGESHFVLSGLPTLVCPNQLVQSEGLPLLRGLSMSPERRMNGATFLIVSDDETPVRQSRKEKVDTACGTPFR